MLLADIGFDGRVWQAVADRMAADVEVTSVDPRGWGRSEPSDAIVAANAGEASRDAVLAALIDAVLPASLAGRPEDDLVTTILRDNLDGYLDLRGPASSGDDGDLPRAQLENVRCPVIVAIPRYASPLQSWAQRVVLDRVPDARPASLAVADGPELRPSYPPSCPVRPR